MIRDGPGEKKMKLLSAIVVLVFCASAALADQQRALWPDSATTTKKPVASVASLVDGLASRLHENPDDAGGWLLLAKSYRHLDRPRDAGIAYRKAVALGKTDAELQAWLAQQATTDDDLDVVREWLNSETGE
jgi:cytochrome c-type biogenesis protein CcmH